ncbi:unnamed protein product [Fraxinus pennsylvanica]|uniref:Uncharacterized protein n=1 Tax=Fraxinus pennsylvanica TaxID=56036 RepID=A0AAD2AC70_9LAMI|nr:unnamed protein product [Fraxinus pennsylvanica]
MQRFWISRLSISNFLRVPKLRKQSLNSWSAVQDTYYSTKEIFERHRVVFTISTSIASIATAWAGYTIRHLHESRVEQKLETIEKAMKSNYQIEDPEFKRLVSNTVSFPACVATAGTTLIIGYGLGWLGGKWYANRKFRKEQMKLLGQIKPKKWPLRFLRRPLSRPKLPESATKTSVILQKDTSVAQCPGRTNPAC